MKKNIYSLIAIIVIILVIIGISVLSSKKAGDSGVSSLTPATVTLLSVEKVPGTAATADALTRAIHWATAGYPTDAGVNINLMKKTSNSPETYTLVRQIGTNTANDGTDTWVPTSNEKGSDYYIEVTCSTTKEIKQACSLTSQPIKVS